MLSEVEWERRCAADFFQPRAIGFHCWFTGQPDAYFMKDVGCVRIRRLDNAIVNPLAFAARCNHARTPQVGKMPRNLWLVQLQHFNQKTDADFVFANQIDQPQSGTIGERFEQKSDAVFLCFS